jgi:glucan phosphoethanolaminetransferase (alkaline phosphatase superfamily)
MWDLAEKWVWLGLAAINLWDIWRWKVKRHDPVWREKWHPPVSWSFISVVLFGLVFVVSCIGH